MHTGLNQRDWFWQDNVHPNPKGNVHYTHLIAKSISDFYDKNNSFPTVEYTKKN